MAESYVYKMATILVQFGMYLALTTLYKEKYPVYIEAAPELDSNPGPLSYKVPALTTLLYRFMCLR